MKSVFVLALLLARGVAGADDLNPLLDAHYAPVRTEVLRVLASYPPDRYYYVNIGRCSSPVMAMIQALHGESAGRNVPFSQLMHFEPPGVRVFLYGDRGRNKLDAEWTERVRLYTPEAIERFHAHLREFLPTRAETGDRRVLVIDWTDHGRSIANLARESKRFAVEAAPAQRHDYEFLALLREGNGVVEGQLRARGIHVRRVGPRAADALSDRTFRAFAEYAGPAPYVGASAGPNTPSAAYARLRASLAARAQDDPEVRYHLAHAGHAPALRERARRTCGRALELARDFGARARRGFARR